MSGGLKCAGPTHVAGPTGAGAGREEGGRMEGKEGGEGGRWNKFLTAPWKYLATTIMSAPP